jgi:phytoene dehydrogenase-like protein
VGGQWLESVGVTCLDGEALPGYQAWLPDRVVTLHRDQERWRRERLAAFGDTAAHRAFWALLDRLAELGWAASRAGVSLPVRTARDAWRNLQVLEPEHVFLFRYLRWTLADALRRYGLDGQAPLVGMLAMLVEDTVHSSVQRAPLINAALGITIRGAGLTRHRGGMHGFWRRLVAHYRSLEGGLYCATLVREVTGAAGRFHVATTRGEVVARQVVSAMPASNTAAVAAALGIGERLRPYLRRDEASMGGAVVVFLGVPEQEVAGQELTHHQLLHDYGQPLGEGNNMFVSVSAPGDLASAPAGHRAVMISTHTGLDRWAGLAEPAYQQRKRDLGRRMIDLARRVYPCLGERALVCQVGTPRSYQRFAHRPHGAVGGARQHLGNTNQHAIPHSLGVEGFWLVGDSTWPGLGTVACVLGSRIVAEGVLRTAGAVAR